MQKPDRGKRKDSRGGGSFGLPVYWRSLLLVSALYVVFCRLIELVVLLGRRERSMELEILVLRHEVSILRRQIKQPRFELHDRLLLRR